MLQIFDLVVGYDVSGQSILSIYKC